MQLLNCSRVDKLLRSRSCAPHASSSWRGTSATGSRTAHEVRNGIDFGQASDFWNQNGQDECILLCRYARLSDEASQRSGIICGRDSRPHHPCDVRSATSRRTRSSRCWQDLEVSKFSTHVYIDVNR